MLITSPRIIRVFIFLIGVGCSSAVIAGKEDLKFIINLEPELSLKQNLEALAKEMQEIAKLYKTTNHIAYWETEAKKTFYKLLYSYGYYESAINVDIPEDNKDVIIFNIVAGTRYTISSVSIQYTKNSNKNIVLPNLDKLKINPGKFVRAAKILDSQEKIKKFIEKNNCLLSLSISHQAIIDYLNNQIEVVFLVDVGPTATIEKVEFTGLKDVKLEYARKLVKLKNGQCFKRSYINESRGYLQKSGLFGSTQPEIQENVNDDGSVPVIFNLTERKARSVKAGFNYSTDFGVGAGLGWEHRNFFGSGEEVKVDLVGNQKEHNLELGYVKPFFKRDDQTLRLGSKIENNKSKAFDNKGVSIFGFLERELAPDWRGGVGTRLSYDVVKNSATATKSKQNFSLVSIPVFLINDTRNNILDAKRGHEMKFDVIPFFNTSSKEKPFLKASIAASGFFTAKQAKMKPTLALKASTGSIIGIRNLKVPNTEKFYVGGGNSVRGYAYQLVGDVDSKKHPLGGRSFIETTVEVRLRATDSIGIVGFLDSGFAYSSLTPNTKKQLLHGVGLGVRYLTSFGPIRADIGFPLKRRKFIDKSFQLYFGIGQAF